MPSRRDRLWGCLRQLARRARAGMGRAAGRRELEEEMHFHLELLTRDFERAGLAPQAARDAARRRFGNLLALREQSEGAWGFPAVDAVLQDLRYGLRML